MPNHHMRDWRERYQRLGGDAYVEDAERRVREHRLERRRERDRYRAVHPSPHSVTMTQEQECLARELHDVTSAFVHTMRPWDELSQDARDVFLTRARRMVEEGWNFDPPGDDEDETPRSSWLVEP